MLAAALTLIASASSAPLKYKAACTGSNAVPPISTKASGSVTVTLFNSSYASGYFYATNINQMTAAHLHAGAVGQNGPIVVWAFNSTYGTVSGSIKALFTFNPSVNNVSALLTAGLVYFNIVTTANLAGELRGQLLGPGNISYPAPPLPSPSSTCSTTGRSVCEIVGGSGVSYTMSCPTGLVISNISSAFYGRSDSSTCPYPGGPSFTTDTVCSLSSVLSQLKAASIGRNSYDVTFLSVNDPCPGTYKFFNATWCCASSPSPSFSPSSPSPFPPASDSDYYYSSSVPVKCASKASSTAPAGYTFSPQVTVDKKYTFACGNITKGATYNGAITDSDASLSAVCNNITFCAGFIIFYDGPPFNVDTGTLPDQYCLKLTNDPALFLPAGTTFMKSVCYGFYSKTSFNFATSPYPMISSPPDDGYSSGYSHAAASPSISPTVALSVPPKVTVPTTRKTLPQDYVFMPADSSTNADGKRRTLKQSIYGSDPSESIFFLHCCLASSHHDSFFTVARTGTSVISKTLMAYTIWLGFDENDPYVAWTHYFLANIDKSTAYRVIRTFTNANGEPLQGLVKLAGTSFLTPTGSASLAGTVVTDSNIQAVVKYALDNKLVDPAAPQNLYFVFSKSDNPAVISPLDVATSAGWHSSTSTSRCKYDANGKDDCGKPCTCINTLQYTFSYVATPSDIAWVNYFGNHDASLAPSGDQKIDFFYDTVSSPTSCHPIDNKADPVFVPR